MRLGRREFMVGMLATGVQAILPRGIPGILWRDKDTLLIYDSRIHGIENFMGSSGSGFANKLDIAVLDNKSWFGLMSADLGRFSQVKGFSGWQDFVVMRDVFRDHGLRLRSPEARRDVAGGKSLFIWCMSQVI